MSHYRAGPWPGLTPRGAAVLLACAVFLAIGQIMVGPPQKPLPDLVLAGVTALLPLVVGMRVVRTIGAASGVCGAYLLPTSMVSLLLPSVPPPPLLLVPAVVFDLLLWLEPDHLTAGFELLRHRHVHRARRASAAWQPSTTRASLAGAAFGLVLGVVEPPYRVFIGGNPSAWFGASQWAAIVAATLACAGIGTLLTVRGRAA